MNMNMSTGTVFDRVALACGAISICIGGAGIAGWVVGSRILTAVRLDFIPMAPNTALIVILLGWALFSGSVWHGNRTLRIAIAGISSFCILISGLTLIGIVTGIDLKIDDLLLYTTGTLGAVPVGHMSPVTAICFLLGSTALLVLQFKKNDLVSVLGTVIGFIAGVIIIGYWYGAPLLYGGTIIPVAFTTAVALGVLGVGLNAAAGPDTWPLSSVTGISTRSGILRGLLPVILLLVLIVNWINVVVAGHADSSVVLVSAVTAVLSLVIVYVVISKISHTIGDAIDHSERERKKAEGALRLTNTLLSTQMEVTIDGILVVDEAGKIISYNHRFTEIWGIPHDVIASRSDERVLQSVLDKLVNPEEFLTRVRYLYEHREEKSSEEIQLNDTRTIDRYSAPLNGSDGMYYGRIWFFRDITDRKKAEQEIARTAHEWEVTFNSASDGICLIDANQKLQRCNTRMGEILGGMRLEDLAGRPCWAVVHKTTGPIPECPFVSAKKTLTRTRVEVPSGDLWFEVTADPILDSSGTFAGAVHIMRDITERKRAEEALHASEIRYRRLFEAAQDGILIVDAETGQIVDVNPFLIDMLGFSREQFLAKKLWEIGHFKDIVANKNKFEELCRREYIRYEDLPLGSADGRHVDVEFVSNVYTVDNKKVIQCNIRNITERKRTEAERARLSAIVEQSDEAIMGKTLDGIITSWNAGAERMYGYSAQEIIGKSVSLLVPPDHPDDTLLILERVKNGEPVIRYETLRRKKDGRLINVTLTASPIRDMQNHLIGTSIIGHDITDRKRAEDALRQVNKQLNLLSSITRHDILNQLMALKGYLYLSNKMIDNPTILSGYIQKEEQAANAIEAQITFTRDYQELGVTAPEWQNVNASIEKAVAGLPMRAVRVEVDPNNPEIFADRLFEKVFYNLIDNALRYGGADMKTIRFSSKESETGLRIVCEDDGVGITAEDKKRLFTRGFGKNTGLGLFLSREILAITGITITETGEPGKGARFDIIVPKGMWRMAGRGA